MEKIANELATKRQRGTMRNHSLGAFLRLREPSFWLNFIAALITKTTSKHSKNGTNVSDDLELTKIKQANNLVTTSAHELWRLPRGTARRRVPSLCLAVREVPQLVS